MGKLAPNLGSWGNLLRTWGLGGKIAAHLGFWENFLQTTGLGETSQLSGDLGEICCFFGETLCALWVLGRLAAQIGSWGDSQVSGGLGETCCALQV